MDSRIAPFGWLVAMLLFCTMCSDRAVAFSSHPLGDFVICYFSARAMDALLDETCKPTDN